MVIGVEILEDVKDSRPDETVFAVELPPELVQVENAIPNVPLLECANSAIPVVPISPEQFLILNPEDALEELKVIPVLFTQFNVQLLTFNAEEADPVIAINAALFVCNLRLDTVDVPAPVIVSVPMIVGVFRAPPDHPVMFTPGVMVTFSVTLSRKNMVSPDDATAIADASVVCVPLAADVATINLDTP